ncbi:MAG: DNA repair protein [Lachnospiraceae bacterium]
MTEKELRRLKRAELLELLIAQTEETETLKAKLEQAEAKLASRELAVEEAGNLAEAALRLNGVFEAAQKTADQYLENIRRRAAEGE